MGRHPESGRTLKRRVWKSYRVNLEYVLDDVELLLKNDDADTVVLRADYGNAFGEFGIYGHPPYNPIPALRRVPWVVTTAVDTGTYELKMEKEKTEVTDSKVFPRLEDLSYT